MTDEYYIRRVPFPNRSVRAATFPNDDGSFDIYLNTLLTEAEQQRALEHELRHIRLGHFYSDKPLTEKEAEADGLAVPLASTSPPQRPIPWFDTPQELADWICSHG